VSLRLCHARARQVHIIVKSFDRIVVLTCASVAERLAWVLAIQVATVCA
jgi:hypothetical protein